MLHDSRLGLSAKKIEKSFVSRCGAVAPPGPRPQILLLHLPLWTLPPPPLFSTPPTMSSDAAAPATSTTARASAMLSSALPIENADALRAVVRGAVDLLSSEEEMTVGATACCGCLNSALPVESFEALRAIVRGAVAILAAEVAAEAAAAKAAEEAAAAEAKAAAEAAAAAAAAAEQRASMRSPSNKFGASSASQAALSSGKTDSANSAALSYQTKKWGNSTNNTAA